MFKKIRFTPINLDSEIKENTNVVGKYYQEIWVDVPTQKPIYQLLYKGHWKIPSLIFDDPDTNLYLGGDTSDNVPNRTEDARELCPSWYICSINTVKNPETGFLNEKHSEMVRLKFVENMGTRTLIIFDGMEESNTIDVITFVNKIIARIKQVTDVKINKPNEHPFAINPTVPWEQIPDHNHDRKILKLWYEGYRQKTIGEILGLSERYVGNIICRLRSEHGEEIVPRKDVRNRTDFYQSRDIL